MIFEKSSTFSAASISASKEILNTMKETGLAVNPKWKGKNLTSKKRLGRCPYDPETGEYFFRLVQHEKKKSSVLNQKNTMFLHMPLGFQDNREWRFY